MTASHLLTIVLVCLLASASLGADEGTANRIHEWTFESKKDYADPFNEVQLDLLVTTPDGKKLRVPGFWAGGKIWKARYASPQPGTHRWKLACSDPTNAGLHGVEGSIELKPYTGDNPLYRHGPIRIAADKRHFEHSDGTPFFWLRTTWWMGLSHRL